MLYYVGDDMTSAQAKNLKAGDRVFHLTDKVSGTVSGHTVTEMTIEWDDHKDIPITYRIDMDGGEIGYLKEIKK